MSIQFNVFSWPGLNEGQNTKDQSHNILEGDTGGYNVCGIHNRLFLDFLGRGRGQNPRRECLGKAQFTTLLNASYIK